MKILRCVSLTDIPWKGDGGPAREIATGARDDQRAWRLSDLSPKFPPAFGGVLGANVAQDGAFSKFAGLVWVYAQA
jgi:environmental stress-induced protein Ves